MNHRFCLFLAAIGVATFLSACGSTTPTVAELDGYERMARADHQAEYAELDQQRASGQLSSEQYQVERASLDRRVQNQADTMAWNRHALAQSDLKANNIPTPDQPVDNSPPGVGTVPNSLYNTARNGGTGQQQNNTSYLNSRSSF